MFKLICSLLLSLLLLAGCGYSPLLASNASNKLKHIEIHPIRSIHGAEFYHEIENLLGNSGESLYLLKTQIHNSEEPLIIQKDSDILRNLIHSHITYQLVDKKDGRVLTAGRFRLLSSYDTIDAAFASHVEKEQMTINLARMAASEIKNRLVLYFENCGHENL